MAGEADATPATEPESLIDAAPEAAKPEGEAAPANTESKPSDSQADGKEKEAAADSSEPASLLDEAEDDKGKTPDKADGKPDAEKDGAPAEYGKFNLPEGMELNEGAMAQAAPLFAKHKFSQESAQEFVSLAAELVKDTVGSLEQQQTAARNTLITDWTKQTKAAFGDKLAEATGHVNQAINSLPAQEATEVRNFLRETKIINHPLLFKLLAAHGAALSPDTVVTADAGAQASGPRTLAERMWPSMHKQE